MSKLPGVSFGAVSAPAQPAIPPVAAAPIKIPTSRAEAELLLGELAVSSGALDIKNVILTERLVMARAGIGPEIEAITKTINEQKAALGKWALSVKDTEFADPKSLQMLHGVVGFQLGRRTLALKARETWDGVLARLKGKWKKFVRVKREINLSALLSAAIDDKKPIAAAQLSKLGLKLERSETFYIELKREGK